VLTSLSGRVTVAYDSLAVAGAKVALVEPFPYRIVDGPVITDADGRFQFESPPVGDWYLFVFADSVFMFDTADARVSIRWGSQVTRDIEMIRSELWGMSPRTIAGRVTDAGTGEPIAGAFVSGIFAIVYHSFVGISIDVEDVTDAEGRYSVTPVNMFVDKLGLIHPLGVCKEGYAPFYVTNVRVPDDPDSVYVLDVALERLARGTRVRGRIVDPSGRPLADLPVALDYADIPLDSLLASAPVTGTGDASDVPVLGTTMRTDTNGRFEIRDLARGTYFVDAAFLPDDGWVGRWDESGVFEITDTEVIDVGDIYVLPAVVPLSPANGEIVHNPRPVLRWKSVPGADRYGLSAGPGHSLNYERSIRGSTEHQFDFDVPAGTHVRWTITAYRTDTPFDEVIAEFEAVQAFTVSQ
jgi:hypothetical protein